MPAGSDYVLLRGGVVMPVAAVRLMLDLEARGFTFEREGDSIVVRPFSQLTDGDRAALRHWKTYVLALLDYQVPEIA